MRSRTAAATASGPRKAAPATYSRVDHIAMVALATVGCLLLLAPQRDPVFTHAVPRPPGRTTLNCRILNSTLKLSPCDDNYDANYVYPLLITGVGRSGTRFAAKTLTALGYDVAHDDARVGRVGASSWPLAIREGTYELPNFATINAGFRGPNPRWRFRRVFHQTRDPLRTVLSRAHSVGMMVSPWVYSDPLLFRDGLGYCPGFPPVVEFVAWREDRTAVERGASWTPEMRLRVALFHYVFWNDWVNAYADWTYKLEDFDAQEIARRASLGPPRPPARPKPAAAAENSRAMDPALASFTWADLERISPVVWRRATRLAREFGYDY